MTNDSTKNVAHANESFRFAQLSDPHLSTPGFPNPLHLINKRILGYLSWLRKRRKIHQRWVLDLAIQQLQQQQVSHYVITGDLTHIGLKNEFEQVSQWLASIGEANNITVIPGNHDLYVNERWDRSFKNWLSYMRGDEENTTLQNPSDDALRCLDQFFPTVRIRSHCAFISLSSVFAAPWFRATGFIHPTQLERLKQILQGAQLKKFLQDLISPSSN